jgi:hypothetical protein
MSASQIETIVRLAEETRPDKLVQQHLACGHIYLPQPTFLRERDSQAGHLEVFTSYTSDKRFKRRRIAAATNRLFLTVARCQARPTPCEWRRPCDHRYLLSGDRLIATALSIARR